MWCATLGHLCCTRPSRDTPWQVITMHICSWCLCEQGMLPGCRGRQSVRVLCNQTEPRRKLNFSFSPFLPLHRTARWRHRQWYRTTSTTRTCSNSSTCLSRKWKTIRYFLSSTFFSLVLLQNNFPPLFNFLFSTFIQSDFLSFPAPLLNVAIPLNVHASPPSLAFTR